MTMVQSNTDLSHGLSCFEAYLPQNRGLLGDSGTISYRSRIILFVLCEA